MRCAKYPLIEWEEEKRERGGVVCDGGVRGVGALREREREREMKLLGGFLGKKEEMERKREEDSVRSERERESFGAHFSSSKEDADF